MTLLDPLPFCALNDRGILSIMMGSPLLISLFVFLQLLAVIAHARTLSENSLNAFRPTNHLEMPSSLSPPFPTAREITPDRSSRQIKKPSAPSPPPPHPPPGPTPSTRPFYLVGCFCSWFTRFCSWFTPIAARTSPCCGKSSSTLASSSLAHEKTSEFNYHCTAQGLCNIFRNRMDSKKPSVPPPPPPLKPNIPVASRQNPHPSKYELTFIMI